MPEDHNSHSPVQLLNVKPEVDPMLD